MQRETGKVTRQWSETSLSDRIVVWAAGRLGMLSHLTVSPQPFPTAVLFQSSLKANSVGSDFGSYCV